MEGCIDGCNLRVRMEWNNRMETAAVVPPFAIFVYLFVLHCVILLLVCTYVVSTVLHTVRYCKNLILSVIFGYMGPYADLVFNSCFYSTTTNNIY